MRMTEWMKQIVRDNPAHTYAVTTGAISSDAEFAASRLEGIAARVTDLDVLRSTMYGVAADLRASVALVTEIEQYRLDLENPTPL